MKHQYDEPTMQAAIDAACKATASSTYRPSFALLRLIKSDTTDDWPKETSARLSLLKTALDLLPEPPPPVVDGKTPGEVTFYILNPHGEWGKLLAGDKALYEAAASAVLAAFGNKPQFDFTTEELAALDSLCETQELKPTQVMRQALRCYQMSVQGQTQPAEIPWTEWHGGPCPLKDDEVDEWQIKFRDGGIDTAPSSPQKTRWHYIDTDGDIIAYRVLKWKAKPEVPTKKGIKQ